MKETLLTMGMPVYNEEKYIGEAIESLLAQTFKDFILIISDNGSTDKTQQICEYYAKKDRRIIYVRQKENKGSSYNFRYVLEQAKTPFFMWCGGHDRWHPSFVKELLPVVGKNGVILSYCKTGQIKIDGTMGENLMDNLDTTTIDNPVKRRLCFLRRINYRSGIFYGIWFLHALKNCNFDLKIYAPDVIILEQALFEGKFKQNKEVLFWMRIVREKETYIQGLKRQFKDITGKKSVEKVNVNILKIVYLLESVKINFKKKYSLSIMIKIWLTINTIIFGFIALFVRPTINAVFKKILQDKTYSELRLFLTKKRDSD